MHARSLPCLPPYSKVPLLLTPLRASKIPPLARRYFVLLSLAEAETIRMIIHMRQGKAVIDGKNVALALRCLPAHDAIFDQTAGFPAAPRYQASVSYNCFRFIDSVMHFKPEELNVLLRSIPAKPVTRDINTFDDDSSWAWFGQCSRRGCGLPSPKG